MTYIILHRIIDLHRIIENDVDQVPMPCAINTTKIMAAVEDPADDQRTRIYWGAQTFWTIAEDLDTVLKSIDGTLKYGDVK